MMMILKQKIITLFHFEEKVRKKQINSIDLYYCKLIILEPNVHSIGSKIVN